jgi:hypothetical protein
MMECASASPVHGGARCRFDSLQIETGRPAESGEDNLEQLVYFAGDFLMDRFRRFFSCVVRLSSIGRERQIFSLTSTKSRLIC